MDRLDVVRQVVTCTNCELHAQCVAPVPFRGEPGPIVVVGEAPGEQEDSKGQPFIGPAGHKLTELLDEAGLAPAGFVNTASCFPHGTPTRDHTDACADNKWTQIDFLDPTWLLLVGKIALKGMRPDLELKRGRTRPFVIRERICFATYHPAAALRNSSYEAAMRSDLAAFAELVEAGADRWLDFVPGTCAGCLAEAEWYESDTGLGWCPLHLPDAQRSAYEARQHQLEADRRDALAESVQRRDSALVAVAAAADPNWMDHAWATLVDYLRSHATFFVDDFWTTTALPKPREARALGPIVMRAAREGLMVKSGEFRKSTASNMTEKPVWTSLICTVT